MAENDAARMEGWDWRPLARLACWAMLGALWLLWSGRHPWALAVSLAREVVLLCLLSLGILAGPLAMIAMGALRAYMALDEILFAFSEGFVGEFARDIPFAGRFLAAFGLEAGLVVGTAWSWRAFGVTTHLLAALGALLGC